MLTQVCGWMGIAAAVYLTGAAPEKFDPTAEAKEYIGKMEVGPNDWPQWGGTPARNNTPDATGIPTTWDPESGANIKWRAMLGSQSYGNPVIANGKVYAGTNNGAGHLARFPSKVDLGCLLCFDEKTGQFLWQSSSEKLPTGRVHDWPLQGICCGPLVEGKRLWFVTSRGEVLCLDTEGFHDGENDGPYQDEEFTSKDEADIVWRLDMMKDLGISQHNMCSCSVTAAGDLLFVITGNGVDEGHINIPAPNAASFVCMDKNTGKVYWTDNAPGININHGQWSSPAYGVLGGVPQVLFPGGDCYLYSYLAEPTDKPQLLWKFDCNPKDAELILGGRGTRNDLISTPVLYDGLVYIATGQDPEHGEGVGHFWCIDPTKRGDVSPTIVYNQKDPTKPVEQRRIKNLYPDQGDFEKPNPNSAEVWCYRSVDQNGDGEISFEEEFHRSCGTAAIKDDILYVADFSGLFHCLDAKTGKPYYTYDMLAASWASPLVVDGHVYISDEDGDVTVLKHGKAQEVVSEINMGNSVYTTPVVANGTLYIANRTHLYAIQEGAQSELEDP